MDSGRMNNWLTSLANIGVLVGLAVLIFEIRQNNELTLAQIEQSRSESLLQWRDERALNDHVAPIIAKGQQFMLEVSDKPLNEMSALEEQTALEKSLEMFDPVERERAEAILFRSFWDFETLYFQYKRGLVSDSYWNERIAPAIMGDVPQWRAVVGGQFEDLGRSEFRDEIERLLSTAE